MFTNDPVHDADNWLSDCEKGEHCECCGCRLEDEYFEVNGEKLCEDCLKDTFRRYIDD